MKFCPKCGNTLKEGNKFCNKCGFNIAMYIENKAIQENNRRIENERIEREKLEREKREQERLERARLEKEELEREKLEKERLEKERRKQERHKKEELNKNLKLKNYSNDIGDKEQEEMSGNDANVKSKKSLLPMFAIIFVLVLILSIYVNFLLNPNLNKNNSNENIFSNQNTSKRGKYKANHDLVVFSDKSGESQVLGIVGKDSVVDVYDIVANTWAKINYNGKTGYILVYWLDKY